MTTTDYLDEPDVLPQEIVDWQPTHRAEPQAGTRPFRSLAAVAAGALAFGAIAIGALAIGRLAIGKIAVGKARIGRLEVDDLVVRRISRPD